MDPAGLLLQQISDKQDVVNAYLAKVLPKKRRLQNVAVTGGSLAAALTAVPAVGGKGFSDWLAGTLNLGIPSWQIFCGLAALASLIVTLATQHLKSNNIEERVGRALGCGAKLETLEVGIRTGLVDLKHAFAEYMKCAEEIAFMTRA